MRRAARARRREARAVMDADVDDDDDFDVVVDGVDARPAPGLHVNPFLDKMRAAAFHRFFDRDDGVPRDEPRALARETLETHAPAKRARDAFGARAGAHVRRLSRGPDPSPTRPRASVQALLSQKVHRPVVSRVERVSDVSSERGTAAARRRRRSRARQRARRVSRGGRRARSTVSRRPPSSPTVTIRVYI